MDVVMVVFFLRGFTAKHFLPREKKMFSVAVAELFHDLSPNDVYNSNNDDCNGRDSPLPLSESKSIFKTTHTLPGSMLVSPIFDAISRNDDRAVETMLLCNVSRETRNHKGYTPIVYALLGGKISIAIRLVDPRKPYTGRSDGRPTLKDEYHPLILAAERGADEVVRRLLAANPDVYVRGKRGETIVHHAAEFVASVTTLNDIYMHDPDAFRVLANSIDNHGVSPLAVAVARNNITAFTFLITHGAIFGDNFDTVIASVANRCADAARIKHSVHKARQARRELKN